MKAQVGERAKRLLLTPEGKKKLYDTLSKRKLSRSPSQPHAEDDADKEAPNNDQ
ncbi:MAG: hypothetical protein AAGB12_09165 [Pseudomonadota bacterium]